MPEGFTAITAHTGCDDTPMDSMDSVRMGLSLGADCVEVDVRLDENMIPMLSHDKRESYSDAVPLSDVFTVINTCTAPQPVSVNCDIKEPAALPVVLHLAKQMQLPREKLIFSGSVSCDMLAQDPNITRNSRVFLNVEELLKYRLAGETRDLSSLLSDPWKRIRPYYNDLIMSELSYIQSTMASLNAEVLNMPFWGLSDTHFIEFQYRNIRYSLWTVNEESDLKRFLSCKAANVTTKQVQRALAVRSALQMP